MTTIKPGIIKKAIDEYGSNYKKVFSIEATTPWSTRNYNSLSNLIDYTVPDDYRYFSKEQVNASITVTFTNPMIIGSYALQSMYHSTEFINYPTSWEAYAYDQYNKWKLIDYQKHNDYLNYHFATKRFFFHPIRATKFKIVQLSNTYAYQDLNYPNCFTLKRIEIYNSLLSTNHRRKRVLLIRELII